MGPIITDWDAEEINGVRMNIGQEPWQPKKTWRDDGFTCVEGRVLRSHVWPATGKWVHNKASLWYVPHFSIKLFNQIEPVPAIFGVYDHGLDGHSANNDTNSVLVP